MRSGNNGFSLRTRNVAEIFTIICRNQRTLQNRAMVRHLNIRAIRNLTGLIVKGEYPNEWYELDGVKIQNYPEYKKARPSDGRPGLNKYLEFVDTWYLHTTHLKRSKSWLSEFLTIDRLKKHKWLSGFMGTKLITMDKSELPGVLQKS